MRVETNPQPNGLTVSLSTLWPLIAGAVIGVISWLANTLYKVAVQDQLQTLRAEIDAIKTQIKDIQIEAATHKQMLTSVHEMTENIYERFIK